MLDVEIRPGLRLSAAPALFIASLRAVVLADLHWGYATSQRAAGRLVPLWGDEDLESRLHAVIAHYDPDLVIIAGDVVHAKAGADHARMMLEQLGRERRLVLVGGNHDRRSALTCVPSFEIADYLIHHGDQPFAVPAGAIEIVGHHHPAATLHDGAGTWVKVPALVEAPRRLILPAFSPWAAGVAWNDQLRADEQLWLISPKRIFPLPRTKAPRT